MNAIFLHCPDTAPVLGQPDRLPPVVKSGLGFANLRHGRIGNRGSVTPV
jgi:hypothetical protein